MPSSIYSDISDIPTLAHVEKSAITAQAILLKLETSLAATRDLLDKALKLCLAVEVERTEMARNPRFQKFINRPLADNKVQYEEMKTFLRHTKHHNQITTQNWIPRHLKSPAGIAMFAGEELRSRICQVLKVQRQKERRVRRMEDLYAKEKDLVARILQVRSWVRKWEEERKGKVPGDRVLARATGTRGRRKRP